MTIAERPGTLIVSSPFLSRGRAVALAVATGVVFVFLGALTYGGSAARRGPEPIGMAVVFVVCGYVALILAVNRTVANVRRDRIVVRRGPVPMWPAATIDAARVEVVRAAVMHAIAGRGGRAVLNPVVVSLVGGRSAAIIDDAGDAEDARRVAAVIAEWLWSHDA